MYYVNQILNINGHEVDNQESGLLLALKIAFLQQGGNTKCEGWTKSKDHGLVLYWSTVSVFSSDVNVLMTPLSPENIIPMVLSWLSDNAPENFNLGEWDGDCDHDGSNSLGWRVYKEDWGHVHNHWQAICAIKPIYVWHGK